METPNPALRYFDFYIDESPNGIRYFIAGRLVHQLEFEDRRTYKTTALIQFVAERLLILPPPARVAVICPDYHIARHFDDQYRVAFPNLRRPIVTTVEEVLHRGTLAGSGTTEVYAEEIFQIPPRLLHQVPNFIVGIGTLNHPVSLRIENW
jgi:hypothetical protein